MNLFNRVLPFLACCISGLALLAAFTSRDAAEVPPAADTADTDGLDAAMSEIRQLRDDVSMLRTEIAGMGQMTAPAVAAPQTVAPETTEINLADGASNLQQQMFDLRNAVEGIRTELVRGGALRPGSNEVWLANNAIMDPQANIKDKVAALRTLRRAGPISDDVVKQMAQAYYTTDNANAQADIFRQLEGVTTPELRAPLLDAASKATNTRVRQEAAGALGHYLPDRDAAIQLANLAANDPAGSVRREATRALKRLKNQ